MSTREPVRRDHPDTATIGMAGLPAYSGPFGRCPKCGEPGGRTEWHWAAGGLAPQAMGGRAPACGELGDLVGPAVEGEHLCRLCANCGYGWAESCTIGSAAGLGRALLPPPAGGALLFSLASGLASARALSLLSLLLGGGRWWRHGSPSQLPSPSRSRPAT